MADPHRSAPSKRPAKSRALAKNPVARKSARVAALAEATPPPARLQPIEDTAAAVATRAAATTPAPEPETADAPAGTAEKLSGQFALGRLGDFMPGDLVDTAKMVLAQARRKPGAVVRATVGFGGELLKIVGGESKLAPEAGDKRFGDPAWQSSWLYRGWLKGYLALGQSLQRYAQQSGLDAKESERAAFLMSQLSDALAPTNSLLGNPAALRKAVDTGGSSLRRGLANLAGDIAAGRNLPSQSNDKDFKVGENLACTPGAVVLRAEMFELLQYAPQTEKVRAKPIVVVPSIVNKYYAFDLAPGRSVFEYFVKQGFTLFTIVWRNPRPEHDHWGMAEYQEAIDQALDAAREICDVPDVNVWAVCGAGPVVSSLLGYHAANKQQKAASLMQFVAPHDMSAIGDIPGIGAFTDRKFSAKKKARGPRRISANDFGLLFGLLRPNDLIWNYWVNNYLLGNDPPTFDILTWNNDATGMTAAFNRDFAQMVETNPLVKPGAMKVRGKPIADLAKLGIDSYVLAAMTDHLCLWQDVYRTARMLGERSQFVLGSSGHIQTIVCPPGNPKFSYYTNAGKKPVAAEEWLAGATRNPGSWWDHCVAWTHERAGELVDPPAKPGNRKYPSLGKAPGKYVLERS
ncbi:MAG TPA: class II poly(R)-hydroxyalkanoic acid synthase [Rubrivivax sp.]|nr:class II poly(R)-hydroxyalkanoic acid synthase [Rubrivivax sp.]